MPQLVNVPGVGTVRFPDGMAQSDILGHVQRLRSRAVATKEIPAARPSPTPTPVNPNPAPSMPKAQAGPMPTTLAAPPVPAGSVPGGSGILGELLRPRNVMAAALPMAAGTGVGIPVAAGLALLGGAGGEGIEQTIQALSGGKPQATSSADAAQQMATEGAIQGALEGGMRGGVKLAGKALAPFASTMSAEATRAMDFLRSRLEPPKTAVQGAFRRVGERLGIDPTTLLPAQATSSRALDIAENIAENALIGGGRIGAIKNQQTQLLRNAGDDIARQLGSYEDPVIVGDALGAAIRGNLDTAELSARALYSQVAKDGSGVIVDVQPLKEFAIEIANTAKAAGGLDQQSSTLAGALSNLDDQVPWPVAEMARKALLARIREFAAQGTKAPSLGVAKKATRLIHEQMEDALGDQAPHLLPIWGQARGQTRELKATFNNRFIRRMIVAADERFGAQPEALVKQLWSSPSRIAQMRKAIGNDPALWQRVQRWHLQSLYDGASNAGELVGSKLREKLIDAGGNFRPEIVATYDAAHRHTLREFANALEVTQRKNQTDIGKFAVQLTQWGALMHLGSAATGGPSGSRAFTTGSALAVITPAVLSRMMTNPATVRWLTKGIQLPAGSPQAASVLGRIAQAALRAESEASNQPGEAGDPQAAAR